MATDGPKIIDGDTAHDTYWGIMDCYDSGVDLDQIVSEFPLQKSGHFDDFDHEIYVTSCGLAYWELGLMNPERLAYIKAIIDKDAGVKEWSQYSEKESKARKAVLKRYLKKIEQPNQKVRKPKKYRKVSNFVFSENCILIFPLSNGDYAAMACVKIDQYRGTCAYWLVPIDYSAKEKPTLEQVLQADILGRTIGSGSSREQTLASQPGLEKIWNHVGGTPKFCFGFVIHAIVHKDFFLIKDKFEKIGELDFAEGLKTVGSFSYNSSLEDYESLYSDLEHYIAFGAKRFPLTTVLND